MTKVPDDFFIFSINNNDVTIQQITMQASDVMSALSKPTCDYFAVKCEW